MQLDSTSALRFNAQRNGIETQHHQCVIRAERSGVEDGRGPQEADYRRAGRDYRLTDVSGNVIRRFSRSVTASKHNTINVSSERSAAESKMGMDHKKLTYRHAGRDYRLTDVSGNVIKEILA